ncbi:MAG: LysR family transcriptional regulator [Paracoccaceae bacterium]
MSTFQNWSDVRAFLAVVRAGSTLAASRTLGMAQPTVARRIEALEHSLGIVLFERNTRGFQPTPAAQALIGAAEALETAVCDFADVADRWSASNSRIIRITAVEAAFNTRFSGILEDFISSYGDVQFELMPSDERVDISAGHADVAIRLAKKIDDQTLICRKITDIRASLFASSSYAAKHALPTTENDLRGHKFLVFKGDRAPRDINDWLLERISPSQIAMTCPDMKSMQTAVQMGVGIGLLPTRFERNTDNIVRCFSLPEETAMPSWLLVNPAAYRRPEVKAFTAYFAPRYSAMYRED